MSSTTAPRYGQVRVWRLTDEAIEILDDIAEDLGVSSRVALETALRFVASRRRTTDYTSLLRRHTDRFPTRSAG